MPDPYTRSLEVKVANYIATVQPELDRLEAYRSQSRRFVKRASQCVGTLVGLGLVDREDASGLIDKIAEDHSQAFEVLERIATASQVSRMGSRSNEKSAEDDSDVDQGVKIWADAFSSTDA